MNVFVTDKLEEATTSGTCTKCLLSNPLPSLRIPAHCFTYTLLFIPVNPFSLALIFNLAPNLSTVQKTFLSIITLKAYKRQGPLHSKAHSMAGNKFEDFPLLFTR